MWKPNKENFTRNKQMTRLILQGLIDEVFPYSLSHLESRLSLPGWANCGTFILQQPRQIRQIKTRHGQESSIVVLNALKN